MNEQIPEHLEIAADGALDLRSGSIWTKNFCLLCFANLTLLMGVQLLLPTLPLYLLTVGGVQSDVGFVMGIYTIGAMLMRAVSGWLSDRYGRKKIMAVGLAMILFITLFYHGADRVSLVAWVRAFQGIAFGLAGTAVGAMAADCVPVARMAEGLGYFGLTSTLSMGVAPMIGIWVVGKFGYPVLFAVVNAMAMVTLLAGMSVKSARQGAKALKSQVAFRLSNVFEKAALLPSAVMFLLTLVNSSVVYFIALFAADLHIGNIGIFFAANSLLMIISRPLSGRWADRGGSTIVLSIGLLSLTVGMIAVSLSHTIPGFLVAGALAGFGAGFAIPTLQALAVRRVAPERRGAATGTYFAAFDMGFGAGAFIWGFVSETLGYRTMYLTTLIPIALAAAVYFGFRTRMVPGKVAEGALEGSVTP